MNLKTNKYVLESDKNKEILKYLKECDNNTLYQLLSETSKYRSLNHDAQYLLKRYNTNYDFFGPSEISLKEHYLYHLVMLNNLPEKYVNIDVSPINPLGLNSNLSMLSQNLVLSTIKNSEVCGDPTTALALEASKRRKENQTGDINLATITRILRMQPFDSSKGYMQHFNLIGILTLANKKNNKNLFHDVFCEHISIWINLAEKLKKYGFDLGTIEVGITNIDFVESIIENETFSRELVTKNSLNDDFDFTNSLDIKIPDKIYSYNDLPQEVIEKYSLYKFKQKFNEVESIIKELKEKYPKVNFYIDMQRKAGLGYYNGICFHIYSNVNDNKIQLSDGGVSDWCAQLLSDHNEQTVTSGFGAELILKLFGKENSLEEILND